MENDDKLLEVILEELREVRTDIKELRKEQSTLKTRFMMVAITMGVAGGKLSAIFPFLK